MGDTIRNFVVAAIALTPIIWNVPCPAQTAGMEIPDSLKGQLGAAAEAFGSKAKEAIKSAVDTAPIPNFTNPIERAGTLKGGPSTEPAGNRNQRWMTDNTAATRPSTEPFLQGRAAAGSRQPTAQPATGTQSSNLSTSNAGFGKLPENINLPTRSAAGLTANERQSTLGPNEKLGAQEFDIYNRGAQGTNRGTNTRTGETAVSRLGAAGTNSRMANVENQASLDQPGLGLPTSEVFPRRNSFETDWTPEQIATLGSYFDIPANDPRLREPEIVNQLFLEYQQWLRDQELVRRQQLAAEADSRRNPASTNLSNTTADWERYGLPSSTIGFGANQQAAPNNSNRSAQSNLGAPIAALASANASPNEQPPVTRQRSIPSRPLYDQYGNRVDSEGNIIDQYGNPVGEAEAYRLTTGRVMQEKLDQFKQEQQEFLRQMREQAKATPNGQAATAPSQVAVNPTQGTKSISAKNSSAPPSPDSSFNASPEHIRRRADLAGIGSGAESFAKSNPFVNIFLLFSLVSNGFLLIWMHRLWHHHRDLIASSRMAASGIAAND